MGLLLMVQMKAQEMFHCAVAHLQQDRQAT
jgi:hypothetical protein